MAMSATKKLRVLKSNRGRCGYCLVSPATVVDHIMPRSRNGGSSERNLAPSCRLCNLDKSDMTPEEWMAWRIGNRLPWPPVWDQEQFSSRDILVESLIAENLMLLQHIRVLEVMETTRKLPLLGVTPLSEIHARALRENLKFDRLMIIKLGCVVVDDGKVCGKNIYHMGHKFCVRHLRRFQRYGDPLGTGKHKYRDPEWCKSQSAKAKAQWAPGGSLRAAHESEPWDRTRRDDVA